MLLKNKKRIAALLTAVVIVLTTAFSLPGVTMAEEDTATGSDAVETEETTDASTEAMEETEEAVEDLSSSLKIHSRYWDGWIIGDYLNVTASGYTPSLHGALKATDSAGQETEAYCMQSRKSSAQTDKVYTEGKPLWLTDAETAADIALMMFAYGGRRADPNAYDGRNTQDGGTYGTYIIDGVPTGGLMVLESGKNNQIQTG